MNRYFPTNHPEAASAADSLLALHRSLSYRVVVEQGCVRRLNSVSAVAISPDKNLIAVLRNIGPKWQGGLTPSKDPVNTVSIYTATCGTELAKFELGIKQVLPGTTMGFASDGTLLSVWGREDDGLGDFLVWQDIRVDTLSNTALGLLPAASPGIEIVYDLPIYVSPNCQLAVIENRIGWHEIFRKRRSRGSYFDWPELTFHPAYPLLWSENGDIFAYTFRYDDGEEIQTALGVADAAEGEMMMSISLPGGSKIEPTTLSPSYHYLAVKSYEQRFLGSESAADTVHVVSLESCMVVLTVPPATHGMGSCAAELTFSASDRVAVLIRQPDIAVFGGLDELQIHCLVSCQQLCTFSIPDGCSHISFTPGNDNFIAFLQDHRDRHCKDNLCCSDSLLQYCCTHPSPANRLAAKVMIDEEEDEKAAVLRSCVFGWTCVGALVARMHDHGILAISPDCDSMDLFCISFV